MIAVEIDQGGVAARLNRRDCVSRLDASTDDALSARSTRHNPSLTSYARRHALELPEGGVPHMTYSQWINYFRARFASEEGQTMAEYGVVLAVICLLTVGIFTALSGGINNAVQAVIDVLPG
jgi:Flp pilus assembly pilin Flp